MKLWLKTVSLALPIVVLLFTSGSPASTATQDEKMPLADQIKRFAPTALTADISKLPAKDQQALGKIIAAARYLDPLYRRQIWSGNEALLAKLRTDKSAGGRERLHYFMINQGPWSQLDENQPFIEGVPSRPPQANFYPADITKDEFNTWLAGLPPEEKARATGYFYAIRRDAGGKLKTVPYSEEYREFLEPAARLLREATRLRKLSLCSRTAWRLS